MNEFRPSRFYALVALVLLADQVSKRLIVNALPWNIARPVVPGLFSLTLTQNHGGAWGSFQGRGGMFIGVAILAIAALIFAYHRMKRPHRMASVALALALGGAIGNLTDRLRLGYVVDFFDFYIGPRHWPVFNIADSAITVAIILLACYFLFGHDSEPAPAAKTEGEPLTTERT